MKNLKLITQYGIEYSLPTITLLQQSGLGVAEIAARTCYDSYNASENEAVVEFGDSLGIGDILSDTNIQSVNNIESSELLETLAWVHHHHSIIEHASLSFLIQGTSRGVLQEHARHRIQSISVRSSRYTMSGLINAFIASISVFDALADKQLKGNISKDFFISKVQELDMFVISDKQYNVIEIGNIFDKLYYQREKEGKEAFEKLAIAKSSLPLLEDIAAMESAQTLFDALQSGKNKRNVGDAFKHVVSDNWKVDMVVTFNIRSLKNYFDLRDSGAAWFQIQWLAKGMKEATPLKYLKLIDKEVRKG